MKTTTDLWKLDANALLKELELTPEEKRLAKARAGDLLEAIASSHPEVSRETAARSDAMSAGAPLYIPGLRLHLNVTAASKLALIDAVGIVVKAMVMGKLGLIELSQPLTAGVLTSLIKQFTRLAQPQRQVLDAICRLKRESKLPGYAPTSKAIAKALDRKPAAIERELKPITGKVVSFDEKTRTWRILF